MRNGAYAIAHASMRHRAYPTSPGIPSAGQTLTVAAAAAIAAHAVAAAHGRAPLAALRAWQHRSGRRDDGEPLPEFVKEALRFFIQLLPLLPPRRFFFGRKRRRRRPVVVYTDAMYDPSRTPAGMVGVVILDPDDEEARWRFSSAVVRSCPTPL